MDGGGFRASETGRTGDADLETLERRLRVRARGRADGAADRPGAESFEPSAAEIEIAAVIDQKQDALTAQAAAEAECLEAKLLSLKPRPEGASLAAAAAVEVRQAALRARGLLTAARDRAQQTKEDLAAFRQTHRRASLASYPDSPLLAFGLLAAAAVFEAGFSAALFAQDDAHGLLGGAATAVGLSGSNVALGFLGGYLGLRYLQHVRLTPRIVGAACFTIALIGMLVLNGFAAMWRQDTTSAARNEAALTSQAAITQAFDQCMSRARNRNDPDAAFTAAQRCEGAQRAGLQALQTQSQSLTSRFSPQSLVLLMLGLGVWTFAALKGFDGVDDRYPEYGRMSRIARDAADDLEARREDAHADMETALGRVQQAQEQAAAERQGAVNAMQAAYNSAGGLAAVAGRWGRLETIKQELIALYRAENAAARRTATPATFSAPWPRRDPPANPLTGPGALLQGAKDEAAAAARSASSELSSLSAEVDRALSGLTGEARDAATAG